MLTLDVPSFFLLKRQHSLTVKSVRLVLQLPGFESWLSCTSCVALLRLPTLSVLLLSHL